MVISRKKQILLILMLIIFTFCFCACGKINSLIIYNEDNSVDEIVTINLNNKEIETAGYSVEEIKNYIQNKTKTITDNYIQSLNDKIVTDLLTATNEESQKLKTFYNGITAINKFENGTFTLGVKYKNKDIYKYYYDIKDGGTSSAEIEEYFFYSKVNFKGNTLYARHASLYKLLKQEFEKDYPELTDNINSEVWYTYVADQRREHSDADKVYLVNGKYYHAWKLDVNNPQDKEINIYYNVANQGNCILVAIAFTLMVTALLCVVGVLVVKNKNKKNNSQQNDSENTIN